MKVSELIKELKVFQLIHGEVEVYVYSHENGFVESVDSLELIDDWDGMEENEGCLIRY